MANHVPFIEFLIFLLTSLQCHNKGYLISKKLDEAILPLFTMSQFVQHMDIFQSLPHQIGPKGGKGSLLPVDGPKNVSHRNVMGTCDNTQLNSTFTQIAKSIKRDAGLEGILVSVQLAPYCVVCLIHPMYNTEDFDDDRFLDNRGALGHDLLNDPNRMFIAQETITTYPDVVIAGPLSLVQGGTPTVREALIARLAIYMDGYDIKLPNGKWYSCWGFAVVLLNWEAIKEKSGVGRLVRETGLEYNLTRTDKIFDGNGGFREKIQTIGHSKNSFLLSQKNSISVEMNTTNNVWKMTVGYKDGFRPNWIVYVSAIISFVSFVLGLLLMLILVVKKQHQLLLYRMMPKHVIVKLEKGQTVVERYELATIFFSDIVGFTNLSGVMSPKEVMDMLNEIYSGFDKIVKKHNIYKVETIGDAFIVIGGGPDKSSGRDGAERVALFALEVIQFIRDYETECGRKIYIRAGIASGPVVAGVVGTTLPKYTLFGDTVNLASRMESTGKKMKIQCNDMTYRILQDAPNKVFSFVERNEDGEKGVQVKGKGLIHTWWINEANDKLNRNRSFAEYESSNDDIFTSEKVGIGDV